MLQQYRAYVPMHSNEEFVKLCVGTSAEQASPKLYHLCTAEDAGVEHTVPVPRVMTSVPCCGRNRHFRMAWSSKGGKSYLLVPTDRFAAATAGACTPCCTNAPV